MEQIINTISGWVWEPVLVIICLLAGLYFSIGTRFVQVRRFREMARLLFSTDKSQKTGITSFQAFSMALSGRVGTGNIVGVATAIGFGGPGAIVWMWIIAFLGAGSAFSEATLAQIYKQEHNGQFRGGPAYYIEKGLRCKWLAIVFAAIAVVACGLLLPPVQSNSIADSFANTFQINKSWVGIAVALIIGLVVMGGVKRIANVAQVVAPFMAILYVMLSIVVLICNAGEVPSAFMDMICSAFDIKPVVSGIFGTTVAWGVKRGIYSNEAGQGTGAIVASAAKVSHPVKQGLVQAFSVYIDTLLVCTATAVMILSCETYNIVKEKEHPKADEITCCSIIEEKESIIKEDISTFSIDEKEEISDQEEFSIEDNKYTYLLKNSKAPKGEPNVSYTSAALGTLLGEQWAGIVVSIAMLFFAFTTIMAYYYYAETNLVYLFGKGKKEQFLIWVLRLGVVAMVFVGSLYNARAVWSLGDIGVGAMAWVNIIAILLLSPKAFKALRSYERQKKEGKDPVFDPKEIGIKGADFWESRQSE